MRARIALRGRPSWPCATLFAVVVTAVLGGACSVAEDARRATPVTTRTPMPADAVALGPYEVVTLGSAQDAGMPHLGCFAETCARARARGERARVAALAVRGARDWWLVDATPDLPAQVHAVGSLPAGILLTHAHVGHYTGLMYLGRESMDARGMPVHCSAAMADFLSTHAPWEQLVELGQIELRPFRSGEPIRLEERLVVEPLAVPHRDEYADTHAFAISAGEARSLLYVPDTDRWESWEVPLRVHAQRHTHLLLDGTFFSADEVPGRDLEEIPHPPVRVTMDLLGDLVEAGVTQVAFTHLNHGNPLWDPDSDAARTLRARGFGCAHPGGWRLLLREEP